MYKMKTLCVRQGRHRTHTENPVLLSLQAKTPPAILALADGTVFEGQSIGASGQTVGEVVFNTSLTGYQEILTDPSYAHQLVTLTYPHIGNCGINPQDCESAQIHAQGLIIKDMPQEPSNFRSEQSLSAYLKSEQKIGICSIDTRALTRVLRTQGAQNGAILALEAGQTLTPQFISHAIGLAQSAKSMTGLDLAQEVSTPKAYAFEEGEWQLGHGFSKPADHRFSVVAYDFGVKKNILRMLVERGCAVTVVPAKTSVQEVLALKPQGIFLSNGPGDPQPCDYAIHAAKTLIEQGIPTFGICLGHQIMALASGGEDLQNEVWTPRSEPSGERLGEWSRLYHVTKPWLCRRRERFTPPFKSHACLFVRWIPPRLAKNRQAGFLFPRAPRGLTRPP